MLVQVVLGVFYCYKISKPMAAAETDRKILISEKGDGALGFLVVLVIVPNFLLPSI